MDKTHNLVLDGGGVKGIALVGAISVLESAGYTFRRVAGISAGAVVGGLLAAGYSGQQLYNIMYSVPYEQFRDEGFLSRLGLPGKLASLYFNKGVYQGDFFCRWYEDLLMKKRVSTFEDIRFSENYADEQPYPFVVLAANVSRGRLLHFPRDLREYDVPADQQSIAGAVRASISLPGFYQPVKISGEYVVDGGILSDFPFYCFADDDVPTLGIKLSGQPGVSERVHDIHGPISYGSAVMRTMLNAQDKIHMNNPEVVRNTIFVDTGSVMTTEFNLTREQQTMLYRAGRHAAEKFLARSNG